MKVVFLMDRLFEEPNQPLVNMWQLGNIASGQAITLTFGCLGTLRKFRDGPVPNLPERVEQLREFGERFLKCHEAS